MFYKCPSLDGFSSFILLIFVFPTISQIKNKRNTSGCFTTKLFQKDITGTIRLGKAANVFRKNWVLKSEVVCTVKIISTLIFRIVILNFWCHIWISWKKAVRKNTIHAQLYLKINRRINEKILEVYQKKRSIFKKTVRIKQEQEAPQIHLMLFLCKITIDHHENPSSISHKILKEKKISNDKNYFLLHTV